MYESSLPCQNIHIPRISYCTHIQITHNIRALTKHALHYISCSLTQNNPETYKQMK